ncbi:PaaI family thioesterase [Kitasatospora brasiliensis]|uniref:PaaI family thioesterase n=1 Tax=Kitasatospora brasiliensis TaxID=3058040 RepID=UPI00292D86C1|nr:PaaI family thioesterase [Kitasatospora sp. K002]
MTLTTAEADKLLADHFAPWVRDLGLSTVETGERHAVLRLPWSDRLAREGGGMSGQALMAATDTACVIALSAARGGFGPMTTVQQSTTFQRAVLGQDVLVHARITKLGRRIAFLDITLTAESGAEDAEDPTAHATAVYALG